MAGLARFFRGGVAVLALLALFPARPALAEHASNNSPANSSGLTPAVFEAPAPSGLGSPLHARLLLRLAPSSPGDSGLAQLTQAGRALLHPVRFTRRRPKPSPHPALPPAPFPLTSMPRLSAPPARAAGLPAAVGKEPAPLAPRLPVGTPLALAAVPVALPYGTVGAAIAVPFGRGTGAAAFRRGEQGLVVFDERRPIDLAGLRGDPTFGSATVRELPAATVLRVNLPAGTEIRLARGELGWSVAIVPGPVALKALLPASAGGQLVVSAGAPGQVVAVPDPGTGGTLLVGTQRQPGEGVAVARRMPEFSLLPSWQGVVIEPISDQPVLRRTPTGFVLGSEPGTPALAVSDLSSDSAVPTDAAGFTRRFDIPTLPLPALMQRLHADIDLAAASPPLARLAPRRAAATHLIALGLGAEAESVLRLAMTEDPRGDTPGMRGLAAMAALLAGRTEEAGALDDPRLDGSDEVALWRAVRAAMRQEGSPAAASAFAATLPLLRGYPEPLRDRLLPLAAETMALGGQVKAAGSLLDPPQVAPRPEKAGPGRQPGAEHKADAISEPKAKPAPQQAPDPRPDPRLDLARGFLAEARGDTRTALTIYDALTQGRDQLARARAGLHAAELRLASGAFTPAQAADAEEKLLYAWRGDSRELNLRLRLAALCEQAGQWRQALAQLREAEIALPSARSAIQGKRAEGFNTFIHSDAAERAAPLDMVALVQENMDLLPDGPGSAAVLSKVADRLAALDLPDRAIPLLEKLMHNARDADARGVLGARLAAMQLEAGNPAAARAALDASAAKGFAPELAARRALLAARAQAATGDTAGAIALLAPFHTPAAEERRASLLEAAHDWPAAQRALEAYAAAVLPPTGPLDDAQARLVLRLASVAAQAGDEAALAALREREGPRMANSPLNETFRFLTESPVRAVGDLPRAAREAAAARLLPTSLQALSKLLRPN